MKDGIIINGVSYALQRTTNKETNPCSLCDLYGRCDHHNIFYSMCGAEGGWKDLLGFVYFKKQKNHVNRNH